ncbi:hypothetical protein EW146_g1879 [Bondarzewia mesenterica]|uniref:Uncharacterized protein n=1 Tax=Bondarzewia mesenterica TaxID=1095465 RepID=A0A4S4M2G8_9AGAM|nr:hypothetical protein EW146_g1879 [Bondarzewia mesenterica]
MRTTSLSATRPLSASPPTTSSSSLRRTASYLSLPELYPDPVSSSELLTSCRMLERSSHVPYTRTLQYYKEQRQRTKAAIRSELLSVSSNPLSSCPFPRSRTNSPLAPLQRILPARATFPRSKREPDLYRAAITGHMRCTPEGQKILHMGPRLALSILSATQELERIVACQSHREPDGDVIMTDGSLGLSWVFVPNEDWEMVDTSA